MQDILDTVFTWNRLRNPKDLPKEFPILAIYNQVITLMQYDQEDKCYLYSQFPNQHMHINKLDNDMMYKIIAWAKLPPTYQIIQKMLGHGNMII